MILVLFIVIGAITASVVFLPTNILIGFIAIQIPAGMLVGSFINNAPVEAR